MREREREFHVHELPIFHWAQNQLRSGNNKQGWYQPYSSNHLLYCQDNAPLYATWRLDSVIVGTPANSALGLVTQGFSGHIIRDSWCHGHICCLAPHAMAIENPRIGTHCRTPIQSVQSPKENRTDVSLRGERTRPREGRLCSRTWQFLWREDICSSFCYRVSEAGGTMKIAVWGVHALFRRLLRKAEMAVGEGIKLYIFKRKSPLCNQILFRWSPETGHPNKCRGKEEPRWPICLQAVRKVLYQF